jgi:hypothetical protein
MPNYRKPLTDKEERILVQAQLMGLTTDSMVRIGNRLRALEREAEELSQINEAIHGYTWETPTKEKMTIVNPEGYKIIAHRKSSRRSSGFYYSSMSHSYDLEISKPGTRVKLRQVSDVSLMEGSDWRKRMMPANSKELYSLIRWCNINLHRYTTK